MENPWLHASGGGVGILIYLLPNALLVLLTIVLYFLVLWKAGFRSFLLLTCFSPIAAMAVSYVRWMNVLGDNWFGLLFIMFGPALVGLLPLFLLAFCKWPISSKSHHGKNMQTENT